MSREDLENLEIIDTTAGNNPEQVDTVLDEEDNVIAGVEPAKRGLYNKKNNFFLI